jgi:hypothetical protein
VTEIEAATGAPGQVSQPDDDRRLYKAEDGSQLSPFEQARQDAQEFLRQHRWVPHAGRLARYSAVAGVGAAARLLITPSAAVAVGAWIALTLAWAFLARRSIRASDKQWAIPSGAWRPGEPPPAGVPVATAEAATRVLARAMASGRWHGAWMEIAPCKDPVGHGRCQDAYSVAAGQMIGVLLGEHIAARAGLAAFALAHEVRHQEAWSRYLKMLTVSAQPAAWLVTGWAVPWPWLLAAVAVIQVARTAALWVAEIGCDLGGARAEGRAAALGFLASLGGELGRHVDQQTWLCRVFIIANGGGYPPRQLRSMIIRACIQPARRT